MVYQLRDFVFLCEASNLPRLVLVHSTFQIVSDSHVQRFATAGQNVNVVLMCHVLPIGQEIPLRFAHRNDRIRRSPESFMLVGADTTAHKNGRSVSLRSFGGRRGVSCLVVAVTKDFPTPPGTRDEVGASPPFSRRAGAGMTKCAAEGWRFYFKSNDTNHFYLNH